MHGRGGRRPVLFAALTLACAAAPAAAQVSADEVLFIRGDGQPPMSITQSGDQALIDHFTTQGYVVRVRQDDDPGMVQDAQTAALVFISETVASDSVAQTFQAAGQPLWSLPRPILCSEPYLYDDLRLTGTARTRTTPDRANSNGGIDNGDYGNLPNHHSMYVVQPTHPLAAGLGGPGNRRFAAQAVPMGYGVPGPGATIVARCATNHPWSQNQQPGPPLANRAVLFVYEQGAPLYDNQGTAPARRVGLPWRHLAPTQLDPSGWAILDTAVSYTGSLKRIQGGSSWANASAWSPPGLPGANDSVLVVGAGTVTVPGGTSATVRRLTVAAGVTLDVSGGAVAVNEETVVRGTLLVRDTARLLGSTSVVPGGRLELRGGLLRLGSATCSVAGELVTEGGTIEGDGGGDGDGAPRADLRVTTGTLRANGLVFRNFDAEGLHVQAGATIARLRNVDFGSPAPGSSSRALTIEQPTLNLNAPGCTFAAVGANQNNVRLVDTQTSTAGDVVLNLELRSTSGAGAGPAREAEVGGSAINWVHAAPDTTAGTAIGFPQTAWDLDTFAEYATYAPFRDVDAGGTDRIYVFDPTGNGVDLGYRFDVPSSRGDLVGLPWWDELNGQHVLWVVTTQGWVLRYLDQGPGSSPDPVVAVRIQQSGFVTFTSPPITDASYVYAAGLTGNGQPRLFVMRLTDGTLAWSVSLPYPISSELATELQDGVTKVFAGGRTPGGASGIFSQNFNSSNISPFSYQDDIFSPNSPGSGDESYTREGNAARIRLRQGTNLSGGLRAQFNVTGSPVEVRISFRYRLTLSQHQDSGEYGLALCAVDGVLQGRGGNPWLARLDGDGDGGSLMDTGWATHELALPLGNGQHTLDLGGFCNSSLDTTYLIIFPLPEEANIYFDDVVVSAVQANGVVYRIDTQLRAVDLDNRSAAGAVIAAPYPAFGIGLFVGDETGRVLGIDQTTMNDLLGWPISPNPATPVLGNVWLDWQAKRLYWGDEQGRVHGYDTAGLQLPGFPKQPMGSAAIRGGGLVVDGVLWIGNRDGRLVALDASTGSTLSSDLRFGAGVVVGQVSQDAMGRPSVTTSAGKLLVVLPVQDPTP